MIENAKKDPNSAIIVKDIDGTDILLDSNAFVSYKIENGKITKIPFNSEGYNKYLMIQKIMKVFKITL